MSARNEIKMALAPPEVLDYVRTMGSKKMALGWPSLAVLGFLGGAYISLGVLVASTVAGGMDDTKDSDPGLVTLVYAVLFTVGIIMVVEAGAELFTSSMLLAASAIWKDLSVSDLLKSWALFFASNFVGSLVVMGILADLGGLLDGPAGDFILETAIKKTSRNFGEVFVLGILANWLVCVAVWSSYAAKDVTGRAINVAVPVFAFVVLGGEHSVANMGILPAAWMVDEDEVTWREIWVDNLIPASLGNIVGGVTFVAVLYSYIFRNHAPPPKPSLERRPTGSRVDLTVVGAGTTAPLPAGELRTALGTGQANGEAKDP